MQTSHVSLREAVASPWLLVAQQMKANAVHSPLPGRARPFSVDPYPGKPIKAAQGILAQHGRASGLKCQAFSDTQMVNSPWENHVPEDA